MSPEDVQALIAKGMPEAVEVMVTGDGSKFEATVVNPEFEGMSSLNKQKSVFKTVNEEITSGALHALTIKAYTPEQWADLQA